MSDLVINLAMQGAKEIRELVDTELGKLGSKDPSEGVSFPDTAYHLPYIYGTTGKEVKKVSDLQEISTQIGTIVDGFPKEPELGTALDAGRATLMGEELIKASGYALGQGTSAPYQGFVGDSILRSLGVQLVDGTISGVAAIIGAAPDSKKAVQVVRGLQEKNIMCLLIGSAGGTSVYKQLEEEGVEMGLNTFIVPLGEDTGSLIYALNFAVRAALTFGNLKGGDPGLHEYCRDRVFAFGLALGELDAVKVASAAGAIGLGLPVITDSEVPTIEAPGVCLYEALISETDYDKIVSKCIETRGIKVKVTEVPIPVRYGAAFEGERIRKEDMALEIGGGRTEAFELVLSKEMDEVEDGKVEVIGKDIGDVPEGETLPIALVVNVAGRKMQKDFEPILERQIHHLHNCAMGVLHIGQRSIIWLRISKEAKAKGFTLRHLGDILIAKFHDLYGSIVDKVEVKIYTNEDDVSKLTSLASDTYKQRDERIRGMTDESVEDFYSCLLCQSFAPNHVCIITPERLGLCGAYNWLDAKAAFEIDNTGGNQPVSKGVCLDKEKGQWQGVNDFVFKYSNKKITSFSAYSMIHDPMTSCGCFECVVAVLPGTGGVMVVDRNFSGMTPVGMTFSTLAGVVGGGQQNPGFIGIGKIYIASKKFISADGGLKRLVWMPKGLKDELKEGLAKRAEEEGVLDIIDKIADETVTSDLVGLMEHLAKVEHPALAMGEMV